MVETSDKQRDVRQAEECDDNGWASRSLITKLKLVENSLSLCNGNCTPCSEGVDREGVLMVKFQGQFVRVE